MVPIVVAVVLFTIIFIVIKSTKIRRLSTVHEVPLQSFARGAEQPPPTLSPYSTYRVWYEPSTICPKCRACCTTLSRTTSHSFSSSTSILHWLFTRQHQHAIGSWDGIDVKVFKMVSRNYGSSATADFVGKKISQITVCSLESKCKGIRWTGAMQIQWKPALHWANSIQYGQFLLSQTITQSVIFLFKEPLQLYDHPVNTAIFLWPLGVRMIGFPL